MKTDEQCAVDAPGLNCQQLAAIAMAAALENGLTSTEMTPGGGPTLTFRFHGERQYQAACDAWRNYALALVDVAAPPAFTAAQRAATQIGLALFDDPTLDLFQIADLVASARIGAPAALLSPQLSDTEDTRNGRR
ncbi:hypothetical protein [Stenotrophomonas sp. GZD-301]|uniref:hypothetical protein n=1 Tax=Stenotrophomonas sp. GZD-301 TaxID=3404814 RepID=UPI003BB73943